jgi:tRNA threonylcarbamoyladenosine biosynthesis protein TsaE
VCKSDEVVSSAPQFLRPSADEAALRTLAVALANVVRRGDVVLLVGDLGAGKTTFSKAFAAALGVAHEVTSPTFTIAHGYETSTASVPILMHLDAYRLRGADDLEAVGLFEALDDGAAAVIEWGDVVSTAFPDALTITLGHVDEATRSVALTCSAPGAWASRVAGLANSIEASPC